MKANVMMTKVNAFPLTWFGGDVKVKGGVPKGMIRSCTRSLGGR